MLEGLDSVDWTTLDPDTDVPWLLRGMASADPEEVKEAHRDFDEWWYPHGATFEATIATVPFLVELRLRATHGRPYAIVTAGMLVDPRHPGDPFDGDDPWDDETRLAVAREIV